MRLIGIAWLCILMFTPPALAALNISNASGVNASTAPVANSTIASTDWVVNQIMQRQLDVHFIAVSCFPLALQIPVFSVAVVAAIILFRFHGRDDDPLNTVGFGYKAMSIFALGYLAKVIDSINSCAGAAIFGYFPYGSYGHHPTKKDLASQGS